MPESFYKNVSPDTRKLMEKVDRMRREREKKRPKKIFRAELAIQERFFDYVEEFGNNLPYSKDAAEAKEEEPLTFERDAAFGFRDEVQHDDIEFNPDDYSDVPGTGTDGEPFSMRRARQAADQIEGDSEYEEEFNLISQQVSDLSSEEIEHRDAKMFSGDMFDLFDLKVEEKEIRSDESDVSDHEE